MGTECELRIEAADRHVVVYDNGAAKTDIAVGGSNRYFKAGSYIQSNTSKAARADAVGQVVIAGLAVAHSP